MKEPTKCFTAGQLEGLCEALSIFLSHSEISHYLTLCNLDNSSTAQAKKKRLYNAFAEYQNFKYRSNTILIFIQYALEPSRFVDNKSTFDDAKNRVNKILSFVGYEYLDNGKFRKSEIATTITEAQKRAKNLKTILENRGSHRSIFQYCNAELLADNYFHAVFEAQKGLFERIRTLSKCNMDGTKLIQYVFSNDPVLIINNFRTNSEKDEHSGFCNILKGLCGMFRNPQSHEPKVSWELNEQDALDVLGMISYCHRRLDKAQCIRL